MQVTIREVQEADLPEVLDIYNDAVLNTTAVWSNHTADIESRRALLKDRKAKGYPFLVAALDHTVLGFASFGDFRPWDGYAHTVEHSVYVHRHHHGKGVGKALMPPLIEAARGLGKHVMVAGIDAANTSSIHFHKGFGFAEMGRLKEVGWKFDRWLDLVFMQKMLD
ncbi:GNAT family N-acetyltransferase [Alsobacter soli]|uniref:GNAT family N-acetyltransferase n=1 Tax=Alsobacter soli TaxID=2109933 RepID=A0A2T1HT63_9HYPH|nr:GNAT family N-acetyltransferase [Alsobacter soli]PSC04824.1 GNAT family N-acetyltransferase [Alsobacter soli]